MILNLYRINFEPENPVPGGFAFVLADTLEMAKEAWLADLTGDYVRRNPNSTPEDIADWKNMYLKRWHNTELIPGPFSNGFVIINETGDY